MSFEKQERRSIKQYNATGCADGRLHQEYTFKADICSSKILQEVVI